MIPTEPNVVDSTRFYIPLFSGRVLLRPFEITVIRETLLDKASSNTKI